MRNDPLSLISTQEVCCAGIMESLWRSGIVSCLTLLASTIPSRTWLNGQIVILSPEYTRPWTYSAITRNVLVDSFGKMNTCYCVSVIVNILILKTSWLMATASLVREDVPASTSNGAIRVLSCIWIECIEQKICDKTLLLDMLGPTVLEEKIMVNWSLQFQNYKHHTT